MTTTHDSDTTEKMHQLDAFLVDNRELEALNARLGSFNIFRVLRVELEEDLVKGGDRDMIGDLTAAAVNAALTFAQSTVQQEMQRFQTTMLAGAGLPGMPPGGVPKPGGG